MDQRADGGWWVCESALVHISNLHGMKAQTFFGRGLFGRCAGFQHVQFLAGFEAHGLTGSDADLGAGAGVAADAGLAGPNAEDAKAAQLNALAGGECLFEALEDCIYRSLGLGSGEARTLDYMVNDVLLNQRRYLAGLSLDDSITTYGSDGTGFRALGEYSGCQKIGLRDFSHKKNRSWQVEVHELPPKNENLYHILRIAKRILYGMADSLIDSSEGDLGKCGKGNCMKFGGMGLP
jgi:hypothetical protein